MPPLRSPGRFSFGQSFPTDIAARLSSHVNLQDSNFVRLDQALGVTVPAIMIWCEHHWIGGMVNMTYTMLAPMIVVAFLLPSLTGRVKAAQTFLTGNLIAFIVGLPVFALLPAVGPWSGYHLSPSSLQIQCQSDLFQLRSIGTYVHHANGVICFPSFHVMWAILCAQALWGFRFLRIPVSLLSGLIVLSTMTTGWHYFSDVLGGILLALLAMASSEWLYGASQSIVRSHV
jgi:membrane-associated phospholipid phosphatase